MENNDQEEQTKALSTTVHEPVEQDTIDFHGHPVVAVRLPDERICVVVRWICQSLGIDANAQVRRVRHTPALVDELLMVRVQTEGGPQSMPALTLQGFPGWAFGMNPRQIAAEFQELIIAYQKECAIVLYEHFASKHRRQVVPVEREPITILVPQEPVAPTTMENEDPGTWASYYEQMALFYLRKAGYLDGQWRAMIDGEVGELHARMEGIEETVRSILPSIQPQTLLSEHRLFVRGAMRRLQELTGTPYQALYVDLSDAFGKNKYEDLLEDNWEEIKAWLLRKIEQAKQQRRR